MMMMRICMVMDIHYIYVIYTNITYTLLMNISFSILLRHLKPDTHRKKYKTSVKWRNLNPVFNDEFSFDARPNDLDKQSLMITVWDKVNFKLI